MAETIVQRYYKRLSEREIIRQATYKDLFKITDFLLKVQDDVGYSHVHIDEQYGRKALNHLISSKMGLVLVSYNGEELTGVLAATPIDYWCSEKDYYVTDLLFVSNDPHASSRMIDMVEQWAYGLSINVVDVTLGISSGMNIERTGEFYERKGYRQVGATYMKVLEHEQSRKVC